MNKKDTNKIIEGLETIRKDNSIRIDSLEIERRPRANNLYINKFKIESKK